MAGEALIHHVVERSKPCDQLANPLTQLASDQRIAVVQSFRLESGETLVNVPVAYKSYGTLAVDRNNAIVVCHALTGSADVQSWWCDLLSHNGNGALDTSRFFVICMNCLGSPYGSASPVTAVNGNIQNGCYGPNFPLATVRDDVRLFKQILDHLGVRQIAAVIGGSMGGMHVLEFAYLGTQYVRTIIPIATSACSSAWNIAWNEAQRQCIFADSKYNYGFYDCYDPPNYGLGAARMSALLTYRSRDSLEDRFGRRKQGSRHSNSSIAPVCMSDGMEIFQKRSCTHNEGKGYLGLRRPSTVPPKTQVDQHDQAGGNLRHRPEQNGHPGRTYAAQSYLRHQSEEFVKRFDANCYVVLTRKIDTHDVARDRASSVSAALKMIQQPTLVLGIKSDGLHKYQEQCELAASIPNAQLETIDSLEGHDAFLIEQKQINQIVKRFIRRCLRG
ncbi:hypothetical protein AC578_4406 [Pseudocercospora eumusae]|uniref:AB hydrolase-1 domain-containing protein n=1 Tax=Pseudocercospora eumusae TaxID=321146 RepID=A0A139GVY3_9PEZI|nr:hypothetical protein AC578_4406 [Pseudocercospora eumusae]